MVVTGDIRTNMFMDSSEWIPSWNLSELLKMAIEIASFPMENGDIPWLS